MDRSRPLVVLGLLIALGAAARLVLGTIESEPAAAIGMAEIGPVAARGATRRGRG